MRNMSFSMTVPQFLAGTKDVTRRKGWRNLKAGDRVRAVRKCMGLKKGEKVEALGVIEVVNVWREKLFHCTDDEARREGYPELSGYDFALKFCRAMGCKMTDEVTRIEFRKVDGGAA